ncbi:DUF397 domain-containing protein [Actinosynnema sp. NPDC050436]|uniref:DUF397 domain-containing protein n=1 Tax=Actinosynnema sp. NPDC050436 TaxID=3155659 RepID=UPI0033E1256A
MPTPNFLTARWRRASYTEGNDNCVEIAHTPHTVACRDSKNPTGPTLTFPPASFTGLLTGLKADRL